ncbi:MAG: VWA domain-containing protein [Elusimicrobiota bacterium]
MQRLFWETHVLEKFHNESIMKFGAPDYFWMFLLVIPLVIVYALLFAWKRRILGNFGNIEILGRLMTSASQFLQYFKAALIVLAFVFSVFSLMQPRWGAKLEMVKRKGVDIILAVDVSMSMMAQDIKPNRLERSKHEMMKFIQRLSNDRIGLIAFAGDAFMQCPLTLDYGAARMFIHHISPELIPTAGTDMASAIKKAIQSFNHKERKYKVLILISDGESHAGDAVEWAKKAAEEGIIIFTVGIGNAEGVPIFLSKEGESPVYKKDRSGNIVMTKLDEITLEKIALATDGKYFHAAGGGDELLRISEEISKMEKKEMESQKISQYEERFQWFLIWALIFVIIEFLVPERWGLKKPLEGRFE